MLFRRLLPFVRTLAFRRGVTGAGRVWFGIWVGCEALTRARRLVTPVPEVVDTVVLRSGQRVEIRDLGIDRGTIAAAEKRSRKAAKAAPRRPPARRGR